MIVRILSSSASFSGVTYNMTKVDRDKGELMTVANFGALQGLQNLRPEDYKNYLKSVSANNKAVKKPQFHAAISAEGKSYDKHALTEVAIQWLEKMGYGEQPYLLIYHKDTGNNHIHVVSTRIDKQGKKINSGFENIRAVHNLNIVLGIDEKHNARLDIAKALTYSCSTKAQFLMILENQGYVLREQDGVIQLIKFGKQQGEIERSKIDDRLKKSVYYPGRKAQIKAQFHKYAALYDTVLKPASIPSPGSHKQKTDIYASEFAEYLKNKLGLALIFHAKDGKPPYGYSVIDHSGKAVYKGGEIMPLAELLNAKPQRRDFDNDIDHSEIPPNRADLSPETTAYYKAILEAAMNNYPDLVQGLHHLGLNINERGGRLFLEDTGSQTFIPVDELLDEPALNELYRQYYQSEEITEEISRQYTAIPAPYIAPDIDDEAIYGRKRRRKKT